MQGTLIWSLVRELRSHMPWSNYAHMPQREALVPQLDKAQCTITKTQSSQEKKKKDNTGKENLKMSKKNSQHHNYCSWRDKENSTSETKAEGYI